MIFNYDVSSLKDAINSDVSDLQDAINSRVFAVFGTLESGVSVWGEVFNQSATDERITSSTEIVGVLFDDESRLAYPSYTVSTGTGTVSIQSTTRAFSGTINVAVLLSN